MTREAGKLLQAHLTIVPAAGQGSRLGHDRPKAWVELAGEPILCRTLRSLSASHGCPQIVVVADPPSPEWRDPTIYRRFGCPEVGKVVPGGATRHESVRRGLHAFPLDADAIVLIHDAARPLVGADDVQAVLEAATRVGAAVGGWRVSDTMARVTAEDRLTGNVDREGLFAVATPQAFRFEVLEAALRKAGAGGRDATDEASLVLAAGFEIAAVPVSRRNFKITHPSDLADAETFLAQSVGATA